MLLLSLRTPLLKSGDDLAAILGKGAAIREGDILVVSSKAVATVEGAAIDLQTIPPTPEAEEWSKKCGRSAAFCQAVLRETERRHGRVVGTCPGALLTELRPEGLTAGTIFAANAGLDQSNVAEGWAVGWPVDPVGSVRRLQQELAMLVGSLARCSNKKRETKNEKRKQRIAIILSDSCCIPRRRGVIAYALAVSGIDPLVSEIGHADLFGKPLRITMEARADQLATAANILMGNAGQGIPAVIVRDHGIPLTDFAGWVPAIEPEEDLFPFHPSFTLPRFPNIV